VPWVSKRSSAASERWTVEKVSALVLARDLLDDEIESFVRECWDAGVSRYKLARALGVARSNLYRHYGRGSQGPP